MTIVYLPDCSNPRSVKIRNRLGTVTFNPTLANGWNLTGFSSTVDSQIDETISAIGAVIPSVASVALNKDSKSNLGVQEPGLYQMVYEGNAVIGLKKIEFGLSVNANLSCADIAENAE